MIKDQVLQHDQKKSETYPPNDGQAISANMSGQGWLPSPLNFYYSLSDLLLIVDLQTRPTWSTRIQINSC